MKLKVEILESSKEISQKIGQALVPQINAYMTSAMNKIEKQLPDVLKEAIENSPEYSSILGGRLRYEFGIPDPSAKLSGLLEIWTTSVSATHSRAIVDANGKIKSYFSVEMVKADFSDVLGSNYAFVYDNKRGYTLPWLEWLLLEGSVSLVKNHSVVMQANPRSRTGMALMKVSNSSWEVPSQYAGTISDNWITRSLEAAKDDIYNLIKKAMTL